MMRFFFRAFVPALLLACTQPIPETTDTPSTAALRDESALRFQGNDAIPTDELAAATKDKPTDLAVMWVLSRYYDRGYVDATVTPQTTRAADGRVATVLQITEGERYRVGSIKLSVSDGTPPLGPGVKPASDKIFHRDAIVEQLAAVVREYRLRGHATADARVTTAKRRTADGPEIDLDIVIDPDPR